MPHPDDAELLATPLGELMAAAARRRDERTGTRITYSPKVFIPLTFLCNDTCGYCTFAQPPGRVAGLPRTRRGARHRPSRCPGRLPRGAVHARRAPRGSLRGRPDWLAAHGYATTVDYLAAMCEMVVEETGLLPHANAGALSSDELAQLRPVSVSQGMMIESIRGDLACHRGAPDKDPARRLATLEAAGELQIPFTTGLLVGIGDERQDRLDGLRAIAASHERHGHVQEVIIQNFLPKLLTGMRNAPACPPDEYLWTIAAARLVLPPSIHLQAPPNLSDDFGVLLDAGIDDWGGVSPVTADHVNPERPWPDLDRLRDVTEARGFTLAPRLTAYPEFLDDSLTGPEHWIDPALRFAVLDRSDAEALARDDPGSQFPERVQGTTETADGADVVIVGDRSTQWYSGWNANPPTLLPAPSGPIRGAVAEVLAGFEAGAELGIDEMVTLFEARGREVAAVAEAADRLRRETVGDRVTWVHNRNINYTNVCTFKCKFCGFAKGKISLNLRGTPYLLTIEDIQQRVREAWELGATEVTLQGGIHPSFDGDYYIDVCHAVKDAVPEMHVHAFTALEVHEGAKRLGEPLESYLRRLQAPACGRCRARPRRSSTKGRARSCVPTRSPPTSGSRCTRPRTGSGLRSNVTIMAGSIERPIHWARHIERTRDVQRRTGGFTEYIPLPFVHMASPIYLQRKARRGPTFRETILLHAVGRLAYRGLIDNVQASWVKIGVPGVRQLLQAGVNDLGGTLMDENISRAAGAIHGQKMTEEAFGSLVAPLGRTLARRTTLYDLPEPTHA
jgi:FO synthase